MEGAVALPKAASYTYWVREARADAAPPPAPCKLSADDLSKRPQPAATLGSVWNQAGTWVEKNLSSWASSRIKELFRSFGSLEFSSGKAYIEEVSKCSGDAFVVIVRNKKRVGYTYELSFKFKGFWLFGKEKKKIEGYLDTTEFSFGELEDLQIEVRLNEEKDLTLEDKRRICKDLKLFLNPVRDNLKKFEKSLKTGCCRRNADDILELEVWGLMRGLEACKWLGVLKVIAEVDSEILVKITTKEQGIPWRLHNIMSTIWDISKDFHVFQIQHYNRSCNIVADFLVDFGVTHDTNFLCERDLPNNLLTILYQDVNFGT